MKCQLHADCFLRQNKLEHKLNARARLDAKYYEIVLFLGA